MRVEELLRYVQRRTMEVNAKIVYPDKAQLLKYVSFELLNLSSLEEWDFMSVHVNPVVQTTAGKRNYPLPADFGTNFVRAADDDWWSEDNEISYMCKLDDGQTESYLHYKSPARFFGRNMRGEQNSRPTDYTVQVTGGGSEIHLGPPPDSNSSANYAIRGVYIPTDWDIDDKAETPPLPGNNMYLVNRLLATILQGTEVQAEYEVKAEKNLQSLFQAYGRNRRTRLRPGGLRTYQIYAE